MLFSIQWLVEILGSSEGNLEKSQVLLVPKPLLIGRSILIPQSEAVFPISGTVHLIVASNVGRFEHTPKGTSLKKCLKNSCRLDHFIRLIDFGPIRTRVLLLFPR